jgi:deoxyhypusine synthase
MSNKDPKKSKDISTDRLEDRKKFYDGFEDNLSPVRSLDLNSIDSFSNLAKEMSNTSFGGRLVGESVDTLYSMYTDKDCFKVLTLSGAMTAAKMGLIITEMIDRGLVDAVVSTGALMSHGLVEGIGSSHFKYDESMNDIELYNRGYDRIYDTLELESNLDDMGEVVTNAVKNLSTSKPLSSFEINKQIGKYLSDNLPNSRAILKSAYENNVSVYIPAFTDSVLGLYFGDYNNELKNKGKKPFTFDPFVDLNHFAGLFNNSKTAGIFTIGGGVPRNWAQQVGWYAELLDRFEGEETNVKKKYKYGVRICPEPVVWGGLSGCTYREGVSWGKFVPVEEGGKFTEVLSDATVVWPLIMKAVFEKLDQNGKA